MALHILEELDKIKNSQSIIAKESLVMENSKKTIDDILNCFASSIKSFLAQKIFDAFSQEYKSKVLKQREENNLNTSYTSYSFPGIFDPFYDTFEIISYETDKDDRVRFRVECDKNRQYLGITGAWIPDYFYTVWIDKEELEKEENKVFNI